jgi:hypothetical protein
MAALCPALPCLTTLIRPRLRHTMKDGMLEAPLAMDKQAKPNQTEISIK